VKASEITQLSEQRWYRKTGDELGSCAWELGTALAEGDNDSLSRAHDMLGMYYGGSHAGRAALGKLVQTRTGDPELDDDLDYGLVQILCDTVHAEIAGRQKPVPKFQTSGADWQTKRRAKRMEKFCLAQMHQQQGTHLNIWESMESIFLDAAILGAGVLKVFPDTDRDRISIERNFFHELHVDPVDARYGNPQNLFHVYTMERDKLIEAFASDPKMSKAKRTELVYAIEMAEEESEMRERPDGNHDRIAKGIRVVEAWRLPLSKNTPGKHVFAIQDKLLFEEDWDRPEFPFVILRWNTDRIGWGSKGLAAEVESIHNEVNFNAQKLQERFRICGSKRTYYERGSVAEEDLQANDAEVFIPYSKGAKPPQETRPQPIAEAEVDWLRLVIDFGFRRSGVSEMRASARKEPGVDSGVAIRTLNDMQTARFALKAKAYENAFVQLARQIIYCAKEMSAAGFTMGVKKGDRLDWKNVDLPEGSYDITIAPTASLPNDPAGRMQMAQELFSNQLIGAETFKQLLGWPDLEKEMNHQAAQVRWVEKVIDSMLDADIEKDGLEAYEPPDGMLADKPGAMLQVVNAYFEAMYDDAPEANLALLRRWIQEIDSQIQQAEQAAAMAAAQMQSQAMAQGQAPGQDGIAA
jgi:hypothetical protein